MSTTRNQQAQATAVGAIVRGLVGGAVGGAVFIVVTMWFFTTMGAPANQPLRVIASIVQGKDALANGTADVWVGWVVHIVLSLAFGVGLALIVRGIPSDGMRAAIGLAYGGALFVVNFLILAPLVFDPLTNANKPFELFAHLVFGSVAVLFMLDYDRSGRSRA